MEMLLWEGPHDRQLRKSASYVRTRPGGLTRMRFNYDHSGSLTVDKEKESRLFGLIVGVAEMQFRGPIRTGR